MLIGVLHMKLREMSRKHNIEKARRMLKQAKEKGAKLAILPSLFPIGNTLEIYDNDKKLRSIIKNLAEKIPGSATDVLVNLALDSEMHLISGPLLEQAGPKVFLTTLIISPQGEIIGKYRKIFTSEKDARLGISAGKEPVYMTLDKKYGILAEDDIFSPEINRIILLGDAQLIIGTMKAFAKNQDLVKHFVITRTVENDLPYIIAGEVIENENGDIIGYSPTVVSSPDTLIYKDMEEDEGVILVDSNILRQYTTTKSYNMNNLETIINGFCRSYRKLRPTKKVASSKEEEEEE
ncbi:MAG: carbon-nitrogen hydrolase family protein [Sulfolobaceae archaeon]|nr:carbon-nitrogen hydrolase family protein [Sulfolobaceae archaeon]